jgi:hypothetical protein
MQTKTNLLVFSLSVILSLSVVAMGELPQAIADKDDHDDQKKLKFKQKIGFIANLVIVNPVAAPDGAAATAEFWLDKHGEALKYQISIENMDISGFGDTNDDVTKLHFHESHHGAHVLNVYKAPGQDDNDLVVKPTEGIIQGIWDDGDENQSYGGHNNSETFTSQLENLCSGELFVMIHGEGGAGVLKGTIESNSHGEKICKKLGF